MSMKRTAGIEPMPLLGVESGIAIHGVSPGLVGRLFRCELPWPQWVDVALVDRARARIVLPIIPGSRTASDVTRALGLSSDGY